MDRRSFIKTLPALGAVAVPAIASPEAVPTKIDRDLFGLKALKAVMADVAMPKNMKWWEIGGQTIYPLYSKRGGTPTSSVFIYLVKDRGANFVGHVSEVPIVLAVGSQGSIMQIRIENESMSYPLIAAQITKAIGLLNHA